MHICPDDNIFIKLSEIITAENIKAWVIGGYVRDYILKRDNPDKDIDIVVLGNGIDIARKAASRLAPGTNVSVFRNFGTAMFRYKDYDIEFVGARKESYDRNSRKPVVENGTLEDDQKRRDFTINALAISLNKETYGELTDPFNGLDDLRKKIIRTPLDPDTTFSDDPLRMMRAIRFAVQLDFRIDDETLASISSNAERINILSRERIIAELNKIIMCRKPSRGFILLEETGLLKMVFPELESLKGVETIEGKAHKDNFLHSLKVLDNISRKTDNIWLRWAALLHDIAKPATRKYDQETGWSFHGHEFLGGKMIPEIFRRLKLPMNDRMKYVRKMVELHLRPIVLSQEIVTDSAVRRLLFDAGDDIDDLMLLCNADITSKNPEKVRRVHANFELVKQKLVEVEAKDAIRNFKNPITGDYIMELYGIEPCNTIGEIKEYIKNAILDGEIGNNFEEAESLMRKKAAELGLKPCK